MKFRVILSALVSLMLLAAAPVTAQQTATGESAVPQEGPRAKTGGAQTLEDILRRQQGLKVDNSFRKDAIGDPANAKPSTDQLGTLGGVSDPEIWRAIRFHEDKATPSSSSVASPVMIQDGGMAWLDWRAGPLRTYGGYGLLAVIGLLALFFLIRGRVKIEGGPSGITIERFKPVERFGHWLAAGSFVLLAFTGLISLFGRVAFIPLFGKDAFATAAQYNKLIHDNVSWAFMLGLVMIFVMWLAHNIPNRLDLVWLIKGGGLFSKHSHPSAKKFNAGQKIIFWGVVILGASISVSGLSLLFPFQMPLFGVTFAKLNALGVPGLLGMQAFPTDLAPQQEMQFAQIWHAIVGFVMMAMILAHIYIGTIGMEGAFDAMGNGEVDLEWARQHHDLWVEEVEAKQGDGRGTPPPEPAE
ncbi:MAG: formate dehydrogenase subunit gamma [Paracoccaceae bacterium]